MGATRHDFEGMEFDWFATDASGHIAIFSSAGWGPVPDAVFAADGAQTEIARRLASLCGVTDGSDLPFANSQLLVSHGIFAYDWHDTYGPYQKIVAPARPLRAEALGPLTNPASLIQLPNIEFATTDVIRAEGIPAFTDVEFRRK